MINQKQNALAIINLLLNSSPKSTSSGLRCFRIRSRSLKCSLSDLVDSLKLDDVLNCREDDTYITLQLPNSSVRVLKALRAFLELLYDYDTDFINKFTIFNQFSFYRSTIDMNELDFVKHVKYLTVFPFAVYFNQDHDQSDLPNPWLFTGHIRAYLKCRTHGGKSNKVSKLWWSWLQGVKRGCELPSDDSVLFSYTKHRDTLIKPPPGLNNRLLDEFQSRCDEITRGFHCVEEVFQISPNACYERPKTRGGAITEILQNTTTEYVDSIPNLTSYVLLGAHDWKGKVKWIYGLASSSLLDIKLMMLDSERIHKEVSVQAVPEPLKVRIVTKGCCYTYWYSKFFQKAMWDHLGKFDCFALTSEPVSTDIISHMLSKAPKHLNHLVSADFSAATDNLSIILTKIVFESFLKRSDLSEFCKDRLRDVLYEQNLNYPVKSGLDPTVQQSGQLMGSPLSFPVLCIVNLIMFWIAYDWSVTNRSDRIRPARVRDLPALVNGDDLLFPADIHLYDTWKALIPVAGFQLSVGKNYFMRDYCTINSVLYHRKIAKLERVEYFHSGAIQGQGRKGENTIFYNLKENYKLTMEGSVNKLRSHFRFIFYNKRKFPKNMRENLFIPESHGGLGFPVYDCVRPFINVTHFQKCLVKTIDRNISQSKLKYYGFSNKMNGVGFKREHFYSEIKKLSYGPMEEQGIEIKEDTVSYLNSTTPYFLNPVPSYHGYPDSFVTTGPTKKDPLDLPEVRLVAIKKTDNLIINEDCYDDVPLPSLKKKFTPTDTSYEAWLKIRTRNRWLMPYEEWKRFLEDLYALPSGSDSDDRVLSPYTSDKDDDLPFSPSYGNL